MPNTYIYVILSNIDTHLCTVHRKTCPRSTMEPRRNVAEYRVSTDVVGGSAIARALAERLNHPRKYIPWKPDRFQLQPCCLNKNGRCGDDTAPPR